MLPRINWIYCCQRTHASPPITSVPFNSYAFSFEMKNFDCEPAQNREHKRKWHVIEFWHENGKTRSRFNGQQRCNRHSAIARSFEGKTRFQSTITFSKRKDTPSRTEFRTILMAEAKYSFHVVVFDSFWIFCDREPMPERHMFDSCKQIIIFCMHSPSACTFFVGVYVYGSADRIQSKMQAIRDHIIRNENERKISNWKN